MLFGYDHFTMERQRIPTTILGATGTVGQRLISLLAEHPWFEITGLGASERSSGRTYEEAVSWKLPGKIPETVSRMRVQSCDPSLFEPGLVFSGLDSAVAGEAEETFAGVGFAVVSNSRNHRMVEDVPLLIPEVNPDHLRLIDVQRARRSGGGFIVTNPNCSTVGLAMVLKPLDEVFGVRRAGVTTMQAISGAGYPGISAMDMLDNVVPYIDGEEEKMESETLKLLGEIDGDVVRPSPMLIGASCNRVMVRDGHLGVLNIDFRNVPGTDEVRQVLERFIGEPQRLNLPSAPQYPIVVRSEKDRPQPVLDRDEGEGMSVVVGRIRGSKIFDITMNFLVHNTIRGAAGAAILNAEMLYRKGYLNV